MAKPFFFRMQANDFAADVFTKADDDLLKWVRQFAADLLSADPQKAVTELGIQLITEARDFKSKKAEAGRKGGQAKASSAKASPKHCSSKQVAHPYPEAETEAVPEKKEHIPFSEIIGYLNLKAEKNFRCGEEHKRHISARWEKGFRVDDFKTAIDNKVASWKNTDSEKYLRPETLFGTKMDGYVNEVKTKDPNELKFVH